MWTHLPNFWKNGQRKCLRLGVRGRQFRAAVSKLWPKGQIQPTSCLVYSQAKNNFYIFRWFCKYLCNVLEFDSRTTKPKISLAGSSPHPHLHLGVWLIFSWNVCALQSNTSSNFQKVVPFLKTNNGDISYGLGEHICKETYSLVLLGRVDHFHIFLCNNLELHIKKASLMQTYLLSNSTFQNLF